MKTIEERAKYNATFIGNQSPFDAYIEGAKEQQEIDIKRAWEWIKTELIDRVNFIGTNHNQYEWEHNFKKIMKGE